MTTPQERLLLRKARVQAKWARVKEAQKAAASAAEQAEADLEWYEFLSLHQEHVFLYLATLPPAGISMSPDCWVDDYKATRAWYYREYVRKTARSSLKDMIHADSMEEYHPEPSWFWWVGAGIGSAMFCAAVFRGCVA